MNTTKALFYLTKLSELAHENILLNTTEMEALIGADKVEELCLFKVVMTTDMVGKRNKKRSVIPKHKRYKEEPLSKFNRRQIIDAIQSALQATT
jgi:hypothetical protein